MFTVPGLKNHTLLRQFVFVDDCGYKFTIWTASTCIHGRARRDGSYPSYKGFQECYWIVNSVIKMLMNSVCTLMFVCCPY